MTDRERNGPSDTNELSDRLFRMVATAALLLGGGSSVLTLSSTDDRYRAADAERDLALRDEKIRRLDRDVDWIKTLIERIQREGPSVGNEEVRAKVADHERRLDALEKSDARRRSD